MPPENEVSTLPVEGDFGTTPETQGTEPSAQAPAEPQETGPAQVESEDTKQSNQPSGRRIPPSGYIKIRQLERTVKDLTERLQKWDSAKTSSPEVPPTPKPNPADLERKFWGNPIAYQEERERQLREELKKELLEKEFPEYLSRKEQEKEYQRNSERALELIFPKSNPASEEGLKERITKEASRAEKIIKILQETGLDEVSKTDPVKAARTVMELYEFKYPSKQARSPNAPSKAQMASTASSSSSGGKKMPTPQELKTEVDALRQRMSDNPEVRFDETFMQRWNNVNAEYSKLIQTKEN